MIINGIIYNLNINKLPYDDMADVSESRKPNRE